MSTPIFFEVSPVKEAQSLKKTEQASGFKQAFQTAARVQRQDKAELNQQALKSETASEMTEQSHDAERSKLQTIKEKTPNRASEVSESNDSQRGAEQEGVASAETVQAPESNTDLKEDIAPADRTNLELTVSAETSESDIPAMEVINESQAVSEQALANSTELVQGSKTQLPPHFWDDFFRITEMQTAGQSEEAHALESHVEELEFSFASLLNPSRTSPEDIESEVESESVHLNPEQVSEKDASQKIDLEMPALNFVNFFQSETQQLTFGTQALNLQNQNPELFQWSQIFTGITESESLLSSLIHQFNQAQEPAPPIKTWSPQNWLRLNSKIPIQPVIQTDHIQSLGLSELNAQVKTQISEYIQQLQHLPTNHDARLDLNRQIMRHLDVLRAGRQNQLQLQLEPSLLGKLKLSLQKDGAHYHLQILAENPMTRDLLDSQMLQLRQHLSQQGVLLKDLELGLFQEQAQDHPTQDQHQSNQPSRRLPFALEMFPEVEDPFLEIKPVVDERQVNTLV